MAHFGQKPAAGPDVVGGFWPGNSIAVCWNRSGEALTTGMVCQLALGAGNHEATEIATNDDNSYKPGASNDTIWNTVVDPVSNAATIGTTGIATGGLYGVALEDIADNAYGRIQFFGLVSAFVVDSGDGDGARPGMILSVTTTNSFDCNTASNKVLVAFYCQSNDGTLSNTPALKRVFLTNGWGLAINPGPPIT